MYKFNKTQDAPCDPTNLAIHYFLSLLVDLIPNCAHIFEKTVSFDNRVHFIVEKNFVIYVNFESGFTFYPEAPTKFNSRTENRKMFPDACKTQVLPK